MYHGYDIPLKGRTIRSGSYEPEPKQGGEKNMEPRNEE